MEIRENRKIDGERKWMLRYVGKRERMLSGKEEKNKIDEGNWEVFRNENEWEEGEGNENVWLVMDGLMVKNGGIIRIGDWNW